MRVCSLIRHVENSWCYESCCGCACHQRDGLLSHASLMSCAWLTNRNCVSGERHGIESGQNWEKVVSARPWLPAVLERKFFPLKIIRRFRRLRASSTFTASILAGFYRAPIARWRSFKVNFFKLEGFEQIWDMPNTDDICITLVWLLKVGEGFQCPSSSSSRFIHFWIAMQLFWGYIHEDVTNLPFLLF